MRMLVTASFALGLLFCSLPAQVRIGTGGADELYQNNCASCHGKDLSGGLGGALLDSSAWVRVGKGSSFLEYVKVGNLDLGMPPFGDVLSDAEIRSLEIYIEEKRQLANPSQQGLLLEKDGVFQTKHHSYVMETVVDGLALPWSLAFLPEGGFLLTEREGNLRIFENEELSEPVRGTPDVWQKGQGGLLEVALHPEYSSNGWIYLGFSSGEDEDSGTTQIVRGRIKRDRWVDEEVIFELPQRFHSKSGVHFGTRLVFQDGYLFFSIGDRGARDTAQELGVPNGKIFRLHDDGRIPKDNPFIADEAALPAIWSYGHRNPQGLDLHPETGELWETEHGPRGGDEINLIRKGLNYGWPKVTYGMNYSGTPITEKTTMKGMKSPKHHWTPSIAVCGIDFYEGVLFSEWTGDLLIGGLSSQELHRVEVEDGEVGEIEILVKDQGRVRDVASGPDGAVYLVLNTPGKIVRLVPAP